MSDKYVSYAESSSEIKAKEDFKKYLVLTASASGRDLPAFLVQHYLDRCAQIGFDVATKGIKSFVDKRLGSKVPTIEEIAELGGKPLETDYKELAIEITGRIMETLGKPAVTFEQFVALCGKQGEAIVNKFGGFYRVRDAKPGDPFHQAQIIYNHALAYLKRDPNKRDLSKLTAVSEQGQRSKQSVRLNEVKPKLNPQLTSLIQDLKKTGLP